MTLRRFALRYHMYSRDEFRTFIIQRLKLSGRNREFRKTSKTELVKRLYKLDSTATFRFADLPAELRDKAYHYMITTSVEFRNMLLVSKQWHEEVEAPFYRTNPCSLRLQQPFGGGKPDTESYFEFKQCESIPWQEIYKRSSTIAEVLSLRTYMFVHIRHLTLLVGEKGSLLSPGQAKDKSDRLVINRGLFALCSFYALEGRECHLKTVKVVRVKRDGGWSDFTTEELISMLWPLKLLARNASVDVSDFGEGVVNGLDLAADDLDASLVEACSWLGGYLYGAEKPVRNPQVNPQKFQKALMKAKVYGLRDSVVLGSHSQHELAAFLRRLESIEADYRGYAESDQNLLAFGSYRVLPFLVHDLRD